MFNKKNLLKIGLFVMFFAGLGASFASAATFKITLNTTGYLEANKLSHIHFVDNGNNFGGFMYFTNGEYNSGNDEGTEIKGGADAVKCKQKMKGFYYNSERGERLWPLDEKTREDWNMDVTITGGLYTRCVKDGYDDMIEDCASPTTPDECEDKCEATDFDECLQCKEAAENACIEEGTQLYLDDNSYYGMIEHGYSGYTYGLVAGVKYETGPSWISVKYELAPTFQRVENRYPVGLIYDYNGGVGLVGCEFIDGYEASLKTFVMDLSGNAGVSSLFTYSGDQVIANSGLNINCNNIGSAGDSLIGMIVDGIVGMSNESEAGIIGNQTNSKMQYFSSSNINNATLINYVKQRAGVLCRGKWQYGTTGINNGDVICTDGILNVNALDYKGRTLIVKNGNVVVTPDNDDSDVVYDIFIDSGVLLIDNTTGTSFVFKQDGFKSDTDISTFNSNVENAYFSGGESYCAENNKIKDQPNCECYCNRFSDWSSIPCQELDGDACKVGDSYLDCDKIEGSTCKQKIIQVVACNTGDNGHLTGELVNTGDLELLTCNRKYYGEDVAVGKLLKGNFIVNGSVSRTGSDDGIDDKYFIHGKFTTKLSSDALIDIFGWECKNGLDSQHNYCPSSLYQNASLVVIDQNYDSPLFW